MKHMRFFTAMAVATSFMGWKAPLGHAQEKEKSNFSEVRLLMEGATNTDEGCTIERFRIVSPCMEREIKALVVLPPEYKEHPEKTYPVLYTLHPYRAPYDNWSCMAPLRQALKDKPMIVTCMDGDADSFYLDSPFLQTARPGDTKKVKSLFTTFFFDEFIPCLDRNYRINPKQRMLTGNSMGASGAFHYMLTKPDQFVSVSTVCGAFFPAYRFEHLLGPITPELDRKNNCWLQILNCVQRKTSSDLYTRWDGRCPASKQPSDAPVPP